MRVLITGGAGLVGRALAEDMAGDGHDVVVLSRDPERAGKLPERVGIERWNAHTADGWGSLADGASAIVNLAGENIAAGRWTSRQKNRIRDSRLHAGRAIVQAVEAAARKPGVIIQASGIGYYGDHKDDKVIEETSPGDDFLARLAIEWEASTYGLQESGIRWATIRTGVVLSNEGGALPRMIVPARFLFAGRFGSGRQWFPWIHIADEVKAIRFLIDNEAASGPYNLVAPNPVTNSEFITYLGNELDRPVLIAMPALALRVLLGEMSIELLKSQRAVPNRLLQMGFEFEYNDVSEALHDLINRGDSRSGR